MKHLLGAALVAALLFSAPAAQAIPAPNEQCISVDLLIQNVQAREPNDQFVVLNQQQMKKFVSTEGLAPPPDKVFNRILIIHDQERALIVLLQDNCVVAASNNVLNWQKLAAHLGLTEA